MGEDGCLQDLVCTRWEKSALLAAELGALGGVLGYAIGAGETEGWSSVDRRVRSLSVRPVLGRGRAGTRFGVVLRLR
jgi:hypothetical protein